MARIPEQEVERLKRDVSIVRLVESKGIALRKHGAGDLIGLCPFHDDREPSLVITPSKNLWHCLGACGAGGTVIDWVMRSEGVSFRHAVELLRSEASLSSSLPKSKTGDGVAKRSSVAKLPAAVDLNADAVADQQLLGQVVSYYHRTLVESAEAQAYLEQRGLVHPEVATHFRLGFANRTLGYTLPKKNRKTGAAIRSRLAALGILRDSGHEHFNGSLVIPVEDGGGDIVQMYGRKIGANLRKGTPLHLYLPGPHHGVFNWSGVSSSSDVVLCESLIDALTFWCAGFTNVTTSYGVNGFLHEHLAGFRACGTKRVLIAYDRDAAGDAAAEKLSKTLSDEGLGVFRVQFPKGMDANAYATTMSPADKALSLAVRQATWMAGPRSAPAKLSVVPSPTKPVDDVPSSLDAEHEPPPTAPPPEPAKAFAPSSAPPPAPAKEQAPSTSTPRPPAPAKASPPISTPPAQPGGASPAPAAVEPSEVKEHEVLFRFDDRLLRVRGLERNKSYDVLKVNLLLARGDRFFVDTVDLYNARQRAGFVKQVSSELEVPAEVVHRDVGRVLLALESMQAKSLEEQAKPKTPSVVLTPEQKQAALALLKDGDLLDRILLDFGRLGVVGEETNKLVGYLATVSRKLDAPLAVIVQSSSAAGKSSLMEAVLSLVPQEERVKYSAMTGQSLYYLGETDLKHKILAIVEEEGAERASYALKLLQSEGELTIASTGKDPQTGELKTKDYRVEGPVMIFLTTTAIEIDEELLNRCLILTVDEGADQTAAIHATQRKRRTLEGLVLKRERSSLLELHQNAQRLLRRLPVVNPYAEQLTFQSHKTRTRRDHLKYLTLIDAVALLYQYQREVKTADVNGTVVEYLEVTPADIAIANRLAHQVLGRTLDELPPQTRCLLADLESMVTKGCEAQSIDRREYRFSRRDVREAIGWGNTQLKVHLGRLVEMEYLVLHRSGARYMYELCYDGGGKAGGPFLPGLLDPAALGERHTYDGDRSGSTGDRSASKRARSGSGRPSVGTRSAGGRSSESASSNRPTAANTAIDETASRNHVSGMNAASHRTSPS